MNHQPISPLAVVLLAACALSSGCASTLRNASKVPATVSSVPRTETVVAANKPPEKVAIQTSIPSSNEVSQRAVAHLAVVQLAPLNAASFDADIPTVGSYATLRAPYQTSEEVEKSNSPASPSAEPEAAQAVANNVSLNNLLMGQYIIENGDSLDIKFRNTPEFDNVVTVRPDGLVSLEIVGDVPAAGLTPELMRQTLVSAYSMELNKPDIAVIVRSFSGNIIYVGGEVLAPGRVPLSGRITTLNAIILAGGFKDTADKRRVVVRHGDGTCCEYDLKSVIECEGGQDIQLRPYDVVYVPKSKIAKVNLFVEQYIDKVLPFSRSFGVFVSHNTGLTSAIGSP